MLMNETNIPVQSLQALIISIVSAACLAFFVLIAFVGPAEYAIDPTGLGKALGLTVLAKPVAQSEKAVLACPTGNALLDWQDIVMITIPAASELEYKFYLDQQAEMAYAWASDGAQLYFDFHGEPAGNKTGYFKSYQETTANKAEGLLVAPFTGTHGWYWQNASSKPVTVTLKTKGQYRIKGLI